MDAWPNLMSLVILFAGALLGGSLWAWWISIGRRKQGSTLPPPGLWPVQGRPLVNSNELEVWNRLKSIFHDLAVVVKVPVLRFTQLRESSRATPAGGSAQLSSVPVQNEQWADMLGKLYSTFAVCTPDGKVVGCVDVVEPHGGTRTGHEFKEALLLKCGIAYIALNIFNFPTAVMLRELFLGELPVQSKDEQMTRGGDSDFYAEMVSFAKQPVKPAS
ncbi:MAG: hypothetical protein JWR74_445 [Polaromonas sp.]|nr:hypothetical protein [Polaromonas sp.]